MLQHVFAHKKIGRGKLRKRLELPKCDMSVCKFTLITFDNRWNDIDADIRHTAPVDISRKLPVPTAQVNDAANVVASHKLSKEAAVLRSIFR